MDKGNCHTSDKQAATKNNTGSGIARAEYKIIALSVIFGLCVWIIDAVLDYLTFYEGTFLGLLITDVPRHEIYIRLVIFGSFVVFGILISRVIAQRRRSEEELRATNQQLQASEQQLRAANQQLLADE